MRKDWDRYFLDIAQTVATRSTCDRANVGCVIVKDKKIVGTGYNGSIHGKDHCSEVGHLMHEGHCVRTIHAELNAILHAERKDLEGAKAYVTHLPCPNCTKHLNQVGIKEVIYLYDYRKSDLHKVFGDGMPIVPFTG